MNARKLFFTWCNLEIENIHLTLARYSTYKLDTKVHHHYIMIQVRNCHIVDPAA